MIYLLALVMFACAGGLVSALLAGLTGGITMPAAFLLAIAASLVGWVCACLIDRLESRMGGAE